MMSTLLPQQQELQVRSEEIAFIIIPITER